LSDTERVVVGLDIRDGKPDKRPAGGTKGKNGR